MIRRRLSFHFKVEYITNNKKLNSCKRLQEVETHKATENHNFISITLASSRNNLFMRRQIIVYDAHLQRITGLFLGLPAAYPIPYPRHLTASVWLQLSTRLRHTVRPNRILGLEPKMVTCKEHAAANRTEIYNNTDEENTFTSC